MEAEKEEAIRELMKLRQSALTEFYLKSAEEMSVLELQNVIKMLKGGKYTISSFEGVTEKIIADYKAHLEEGGTMCVERVLTPTKGGKFIATTEQKFVPWLSDMTKKDTEDILTIISEGEKNLLHPRDIARQLKDKFAQTEHNAMTAARTEAQKIRSDTRFAAYKKQGVEYVEYITAGDERVREEHWQRHGKIYPVDKAPWLGEPNCRCTLVPADYEVLMEGAKVTRSEAEVVSA